MHNNNGEETRKAYVKYSGMAFTMAGAIFMGVMLGKYLDEKFLTERPYWTAGMSILFLILGMYSALREIIFPPKKNK